MADQVRPPPPPQQQTGPTLQASHENTRVVQGVQHQLPIQQQTPAYPNQVGQVFQPSQQQMFQQVGTNKEELLVHVLAVIDQA